MSKKKHKRFLAGFSLTELAVTILTSTIVISGVGFILVSGHRGWHAMFNSVYSDVVTDGYVARRTFDRMVRRSSKAVIDANVPSLMLRYYASPSSKFLDRYALFYVSGGKLKVEYGKVASLGNEVISTHTICSNVQSCVFKKDPASHSVEMILAIDNGSQAASVVSSAYMHNP